jgi:hypothetical protein
MVLFDRDGNPLTHPEPVDLPGEGQAADPQRRTILGTVNPNLFPSIRTELLFPSAAPA